MLSDRLLTAMGTAVLAVCAAACSPEADTPAPPEAGTPMPADPDAPAGISASDGWMSLPPVSGNPGAVYFTISNAGDAATTIVAASLLGAERAEMHETVSTGQQMTMQELAEIPLPAGEELVFAPGGKHVMAFGLGDSLAVGGETELTLSFASGDKISFPVAIRAPGDTGTMGGM
jgi:copper(I)-binding protein